MWGGGSGDEVATRTFTALTAGQVVSIDFDNGNVDDRQSGFSLQTSGGADVLQFYFLGGAANYKYNDGTEQTRGFLSRGLACGFSSFDLRQHLYAVRDSLRRHRPSSMVPTREPSPS